MLPGGTEPGKRPDYSSATDAQERIEGSPFAPESVRHLTGLGMQSGCWVPLIHRGEAIGTLTVASRLEGVFTRREAEMLVQVAAQVAIAVNNAVAFRQIAELHDRLSQEKRYLRSEEHTSE